MASKYWIKLYHDILDDSKMGRMPDRLWRRAIELFLIAGECDGDGSLPTVGDMAYRLRLTDDELIDDINHLIKDKIISQREDGSYYVTNFDERQGPMSKAEYMRRSREQSRKDEYYALQYGNHKRKYEPKSKTVTDPVTNPLPNSYQSVTFGNADKIRLDKIRLDEIRDKSGVTSGNKGGKAETNQEELEQQYIEWFTEIAQVNLPFNPSTYVKWLQQVGEWIDLGITREDIERAVEICDEKELTIVRPASITNVMKSELAYQKRGGNSKQSDDRNVMSFTDPYGNVVEVEL